uniref:Uncharacterized protein n=1 Tax=Arundo donax TaxID=35708 RepID=A0A0A8ZLL5_ARUDO
MFSSSSLIFFILLAMENLGPIMTRGIISANCKKFLICQYFEKFRMIQRM